MVVDYGMSELGPMNFGPQYESNYSKSWSEPSKISDELQEEVDQQIRKIIDAGEKRALELLKKHKKQLDIVSEQLLDVESLDGDEFERLMGMPKAKVSAKPVS
jgi:cell division protease FtsH